MKSGATMLRRDNRPLTTRMAERLTTLKNEYEQGWRAHHELLSENMLPFSGRFFIDDRNKGDRRHLAILDSTPLHATRTLAAGMMSGATSPARTWFQLRVKDYELREDFAVADWLSDVGDVMRSWIDNSNIYHALHAAYEEMAVFGTALILLLPDDDTIFHAYHVTAGRYFLATDAKGKVNTCYREMQMTVAQVVREFGLANCSIETQEAFEQEKFEQLVHVVHAIEPNDERYVEGSTLATQMAYRSVYFEFSHDKNKQTETTLRDGGFDVCPILAFRWNVTGGDVYGNGPGMEALGDAIQLQDMVQAHGDAVHFKLRPPLAVPPGLKHTEVDGEPGGRTTVPNAGRDSGVRPLWEVNQDIQPLILLAEDLRTRIRRTMFTDMFLMLQQIDKTMTAREAIQRNEEKLLMLGPMLERLFDDGLSPLIDLVFHYLFVAGVLPEVPEQLAEADLDVEFVSPLAQAQRGIGINAIDRFLQTAGAIAGMKPNVLDNIDEDAVIRYYGEILGIDPDLLNDPQMMAKLREARAAQQAALEQAQALQQVSAAQKNVADAAAAAPYDPIAQTMGYSNTAVPA